jgi:ribose transport system substrate-binding protein
VTKNDDYVAEADEAYQHYASKGLSRRDIMKRAGIGLLAVPAVATVLAACGSSEDAKAVSTAAASAAAGSGAGLKMLGTNGGVVDWYNQGAAAMQHWCDIFGVDLTFVQAELDSAKQRERLDAEVVKGGWDIAGIVPNESGVIVQPVQALIDSGTVVIQMVSRIAPEGQDLPIFTWVEQSSFEMGLAVASALFEKVNGSGTVIQTQGPSAFTGAQQRALGFAEALKRYPNMELLATDFGDWDVNKAQAQWETYVNKYPKIDVGYFHNDSMALAGYQALKAAGRESQTVLGGADGMPEAIKAVSDGRMFATVRHSAPRIHMYPVVIGVAKKLGAIDTVPAKVIVDGPVVTAENSESLLFLQTDPIMLA